MVIIGAVMRKLVHIMYGVLKSRQAFDHAYTTKLEFEITRMQLDW